MSGPFGRGDLRRYDDLEMTQAERHLVSEQMDAFAKASWLSLSVDQKIEMWRRWFEWSRELVGIAPGRPFCPPGHVPAGLRSTYSTR